MTGHTEDKMCPKCGGVMVYRLGEHECQDCGHIELPGPTKEELDERALNPFLERNDGINRQRLIKPPEQQNVPLSADIPPVFRGNPDGRDEDELNRRYVASQALNAEKHTFMLVFFLVSAGSMILYILLGGTLENIVVRLVGAIVLAAIYTVCMGIPLYYGWDFARKACIVILVIQIIFFTATVVMAVIYSQLGSSWYLVPHIFLNGWLFWILVRDQRGEGDLTGGGCFWGTPSNWIR